MADRLEMASQFIQEQLEKRDDIAGAVVWGSVARGDWNETSDIDVALLLNEVAGKLKWDSEEARSLCTWREGVFIEVKLRPIEDYSGFDRIMHDMVAPTHMRNACILYDPSGVLTEAQRRVRLAFMEPKWIRLRVEPRLRQARDGIYALRDAIAEKSPRSICENMSTLALYLPTLALLQKGITPSARQPMGRLAKVRPALCERIAKLECSQDMSVEDVLRLVTLFSDQLDTMEPTERSPTMKHFEMTLPIMSTAGQLSDVIYNIWVEWRWMPKREEASADMNAKMDALATNLLHFVGWEGEEFFREKLKLAESIMEEIEAITADLPPAERDQ